MNLLVKSSNWLDNNRSLLKQRLINFEFNDPQHRLAIQASTASDKEHVMDFDRLTKLVDML